MYNSDKNCKHYTKNIIDIKYIDKKLKIRILCVYLCLICFSMIERKVYIIMHMYSSVIYIVDVHIINVYPESG